MDRPDYGGGKRRAGDNKNKDNADEDDTPSVDPGEWKSSGDNEAIRQRRRVTVRRGGQAASAGTATEAALTAEAPAPPTASSNPFAGVSLTPPAPAPANPFSGVSLVAPSAAAPAPAASPAAGGAEVQVKPAEGAPSTTDEAKEAQTSTAAAAAPVTAPAPSPAPAQASAAGTSGGSASLTSAPATTSSNPFSALGTGATFGAGFSGAGFGGLGAAGGGFGALGAASAAAGSSGAAPVFGGFNFGKGAFPPLSNFALGAKPKEQKSKEEEEKEGEGQEQGEGDEGCQLFGDQGPSYQPAVSLPEQERKTGEEEERQLYAADGSLYEFDMTDNKWRERGRGEFKVNASDSGTRMVMRQSGNLRLLLNAKVYVNMPVQLMPGKVGVTFGVVNAAAATPAQDEKEAGKAPTKPTEQQAANEAATCKPSTWAVRIKSSEKVASLKDLLTKLREDPSAKEVQGTDGGWDAA